MDYYPTTMIFDFDVDEVFVASSSSSSKIVRTDAAPTTSPRSDVHIRRTRASPDYFGRTRVINRESGSVSWVRFEDDDNTD